MLEVYGDRNAVEPEFWIALRDAANKMNLSDRAEYYEKLSQAPRDSGPPIGESGNEI